MSKYLKILIQPGMLASWNIFLGVTSLIFQGLATFYILWLVNHYLGGDNLGLWSLLSSGVIVLSVFDFGIGPSMFHFSRNRISILSNIYFSAVFASLLLYLTIALLIYFPIKTLLYHLTNNYMHSIINQSIIFIIFISGIFIISRITINTLIGVGLNHSIQIIKIISFFILIPISYLSIINYGILGLLFARLIIELIVLICTYIIFNFYIKKNNIMSYRFNLNYIKEILNISLKFQFSSILTIMFEPFSKFIIATVSSIELVGQYEIAARVTGFVKELFVRPFSYLAGVFSASEQIKNKEVSQREILSKVIYLSIPAALLSIYITVCLIPFVLLFIFDELAHYFIMSTVFLSTGWSFTILSMAAFYFSLGTGKSMYVLISTVINILSSIFGGIMAFIYSNPDLVYIFTSFGLIMGHLYLIFIVKFCTKLIFKPDLRQILISILLLLLTIITFIYLSNEFMYLALGVCFFVCFVLLFVFLQEVRAIARLSKKYS